EVCRFDSNASYDLEPAALEYLVDHQENLEFHVRRPRSQRGNYRLVWHQGNQPVGNLEVRSASRMTRQEIFDHSGYNRIELIFYGPGILFIPLIKWCLARLGMKRLVYHPYYFVSRFEELSRFTTFNNPIWYLPPSFIL